MADAESNVPNKSGCALVVLACIGLVLGAGLWFKQRSDARKTPCEKYADVAARVLYNCHSGQAKDLEHHTAVCEQALDPTPACLERLDALTCDELEQRPEIAAGSSCARK